MAFKLALAGTVLLAATLAATNGPLMPGNVVHATPQQLTLDGSHLAKLFAWDDGQSGGTTTSEYTGPVLPAVSESDIDVGPPAPPGPGPCTPVITKAKGKLTSDGYIVLAGTCFGNGGKVVITGIPSGLPPLVIEAWTPTAITVQLPTITGVPDLTMHITVISGTQTSKVLDAQFVAAMGNPTVLPSKYFKNIECALYGACATDPHKPTGNHWDYSPQNGTDVWTLTVPDHFHLQSINLVHLKSGPTKTSTVSSGGNQVTFTVAWQEQQQPNGSELGTTSSTTTYTCSYEPLFDYQIPLVEPNGHVSCSGGATLQTSTTGGNPIEIPTFNNVYQVQAMVVGPAGMSP